MSIRLRKQLIFALAFIVAFILYWPSMHGLPIWDDYSYWFRDPVMGPKMSYLTIWKDFGWPLSVSLQKMLLAWWNKNYLYYHLLNFTIHGLNSLLVYKLARYLRFKYATFFFLLFLFHPVGVITTAWMIQFKTLICFFFGLASILAYLKGNKRIGWMIFSWVLFACSVTSKSASITLPLILLVLSYRSYKFSKLHFLIPFFLISGWGTYRVIKSPITIEGSEKAAKISNVKAEEPSPEEKVQPVPAPEVKPEPKVEAPKKAVTKVKLPRPKKIKIKKQKPVLTKPIDYGPAESKSTTPVVESKPAIEIRPVPTEQPKNETLKSEKKLSFKLPDFGLISQTMHYYFWQSILPLSNAPVKGLNYDKAGLEQIIHILFLFIIIFLVWKDSALFYLATAHFMLLPFLGIVHAPFMTVTWVSDQHLYLVLPIFIAFWIRILERMNWKYSPIVLGFFVVLYAAKTYEITPVYKNQITFYEASLKYNPMNVPITYNLALAKFLHGDIIATREILENLIQLSNTEPLMKKNHFYPYAMDLYLTVKVRPE